MKAKRKFDRRRLNPESEAHRSLMRADEAIARGVLKDAEAAIAAAEACVACAREAREFPDEDEEAARARLEAKLEAFLQAVDEIKDKKFESEEAEMEAWHVRMYEILGEPPPPEPVAKPPPERKHMRPDAADREHNAIREGDARKARRWGKLGDRLDEAWRVFLDLANEEEALRARLMEKVERCYAHPPRHDFTAATPLENASLRIADASSSSEPEGDGRAGDC